MDDAGRLILSHLLSEFRERKLTTSDLQHSYKGLPPSELKDLCIANGVCEVDYDLAMKELMGEGLVKTGPMRAYDNPPGSFVACTEG
jgi:hypothetical protein